MGKELTSEDLLKRLRYHWASYVARGGFSQPQRHFGRLERGGTEHWTLFLKLGRQYLKEFPKDRYVVEGFIPAKLVKLLVGE